MKPEILAILAIVLLVGIIPLKIALGSKTANRKLFSKGKYEQQQKITGCKLHFSAQTTIEKIKYQLSQHVITEETAPKIYRKLYIQKQNETGIVYAMGNKLAIAFVAILQFSESNGTVTANFSFSSWLEENGVTNAVSSMQDLIDSIKEAFLAADPNMQVSETKQTVK